MLQNLIAQSSLEIREYGCGDPLHWQRDTLYLEKLVLTLSRSGGRSVGIVCLRAQATFDIIPKWELCINSYFLSGLV
jgi:hypothetical protein